MNVIKNSYKTLIVIAFLLIGSCKSKDKNVIVKQNTVDVTDSNSNSNKLKYNFEYNLETPATIKVKLTFEGNSDGVTKLRIPHSWAWINDYELGIKNIKLLNDDADIIHDSENSIVSINHQPFQQITLTYEVFQYWDAQVDRATYYKPILQEDYFHFIGYGVFIIPDWNESVDRDIEVVWDKIPKDWEIGNSFGVNSTTQNLFTSISKFCHATYFSGDFEINKIDVKGFPVYIAKRGQWKFSSTDLNDLIGTSMLAVRAFWKDYEFPYHLIVVLPIQSKRSKGGTGLTNTFEIFVSPDHENVNDLKYLLVHESFHTWNGRKIQRQEPEELVYWFSEGFTNYYTRLILLRNNLITLDEFVKDYNKVLTNYYSSPAVNVTNEKVRALTHEDNQIERIPYLRGDIIAFRWNEMIKKSSDYSLDTVMYDLLYEALNSKMVVSNPNMETLMAKYIKEGVSNDIDNLINEGRDIVLNGDELGPCFELFYADHVLFDLGFEYNKASDNPKHWDITQVAPQSLAFKAGVKKGHKVIGKSIYWNRTDKEVVLKIKNSADSIFRVSYFPLGKKIQIPQYRLKKAKDLKNCEDWFYSN